jgi:hypothetical protein
LKYVSEEDDSWRGWQYVTVEELELWVTVVASVVVVEARDSVSRVEVVVGAYVESSSEEC